MTKTEQEIKDLHKQVCNGNADAEVFCDLWFQFCHGVDDIIDTREDGRATMNPEEILRIFAVAMALYNCPFYILNRAVLHTCAMLIHNIYADTVLFEKAPEPEKRAIADVARCCGNETYFLVANICGGYDHMRKLSPIIRQRSWLLQHDKDAQQF